MSIRRKILAIPLALAGLVTATVGTLSKGGPFYDRWGNDTLPSVKSLYIAGDDRIFTGAGKFDPASRVYNADQVEGALVFGPYVALDAGRYSVKWFGTVQKESHPAFEITSMTDGQVIMHKPPLIPSNASGVLHSIQFTVLRPMEGVEFRIIVKPSDALSVSAIELTAFPSASYD